jgi:hypothetical protein
MRIFDIDYVKFVRLMVPPHLRKVKHVSWLQGLASPVNVLYQLFRRNRNSNIYRLKITPQVCYLERLLNDRYDIAERRIRIQDSITFDPVYIFLQQENKPVFIHTKAEQHPVYLYTLAETSIDPVDFVVVVPVDVVFQVAEMKGVLDAYKLAGKTYSITKQ